nr:immunoglobulin tau heavy chain [Trematomus bernacchii]
MFSVALLLLLAAGSCVKCEQLIQPASVTVQPGQRLTITCQVSYSVSSYFTAWIRQPAGKGLEWIGMAATGNPTHFKDSLKSKFSIDLDSSSNSVTLNGQSVQPGDSAVYYCARVHGRVGGHDYWGQGARVTVSNEIDASPTLFPLVQCNPGSAETITVGCLANDFSPNSVTFQWTDASGTNLPAVQYPPTVKNNKYTGISVVNVPKSDWDLRKSYKCAVTHPGGQKSLSIKKVKAPSCSETNATITMKLNKSSPKEMFNNNQARFDCVISGDEETTVDQFQITWQVNGAIRTTSEQGRSGGIKTSTMRLSLHESLSNVRCSASKDDVTVFQDLPPPKIDGKEPKVTVHIVPEEDIDADPSDEVTLVCLVFSSEKDYYIAWAEHIGQNTPIYQDGIDLPPQKANNGYFVTSIYTTNKTKWQNHMFSCNVWPAGAKKAMAPRTVSNSMNNSIECKK